MSVGYSGAGSKMANLANLANLANISGTRCGANFASVLSTRGERPEPAAIGHAFFRDRDALGLARRIEGLLTEPMCRGVVPELDGRSGSSGQGLAQPGASIVDNGAAAVAIIRSWPLQERGRRPGTLAVPDHAGDGGAGDVFEVEGE